MILAYTSHATQPAAASLFVGARILIDSYSDITKVWKQQDQGQWIARIRFNRQFDARLVSLSRILNHK
jgi:hypothetical protein